MTEEPELVSVERRNDAAVVTIHADRLDSENAATAQAAVQEAAGEQPGAAVAVDLAEVEVLTSAGLGALVYLHTTLRSRNQRLGVCGARGEAAAVIGLARLDRVLEVCGSVGEFLLRIRSAGP